MCVCVYIQLNSEVGGSAEIESRLSDVVVPCIAQLAAECHRDTAALRHLNQLVCDKTKPAEYSPRVSRLSLSLSLFVTLSLSLSLSGFSVDCLLSLSSVL